MEAVLKMRIIIHACRLVFSEEFNYRDHKSACIRLPFLTEHKSPDLCASASSKVTQ